MHIPVYDGEKYERSRSWYIVAGIVYFLLVMLVLFGGNLTGGVEGWMPTWGSIFAAVLLGLLGRWYRTFYQRALQDPVMLSLEEDGLKVGRKSYPWEILTGFGLEVKLSTNQIYNIILMTKQEHHIYTFATDDQEQIREFGLELGDYISLIEEYEHSFLQKWARRLKV